MHMLLAKSNVLLAISLSAAFTLCWKPLTLSKWFVVSSIEFLKNDKKRKLPIRKIAEKGKPKKTVVIGFGQNVILKFFSLTKTGTRGASRIL